MGRHSDDQAQSARAAAVEPAVSAQDVAIWGPFATVVASVAAGLNGAGWVGAALIGGLGAGVTGLLWAAVRRAGGAPRWQPGRRRVQ